MDTNSRDRTVIDLANDGSPGTGADRALPGPDATLDCATATAKDHEPREDPDDAYVEI